MFNKQVKTITHPPFLVEVIGHLNKSNSVEKQLFIFPNQLSIDYFQSLCNKGKGQDGCLTLRQLMLMHSKITPLPTLALLSRLHRLAEQIKKESFEEFYDWGLTILQDFNAIDSYLVNGAELFASLMQQKQVKRDACVDQVDAFKKARGLSGLQQEDALLFWKQLPFLYQSFREKLIEEGKGYEGLCYRMAQPEIMAHGLIFVGFNLLTPVEERFIRQCQAVASTTFFWDADAHYLDNAVNAAGHYLRQDREKGWFKNFVPGTYLNDPHKKVLLREASATVAQVQTVVAALQEKTNDGAPRLLPGQTAIVVSGSDLLIPLLDQLAKLSIPLHCRLDYPFNATVIYTLVVQLVQLWEASIAGREIYSHMADLLALWYPFAKTAVQLEIAAVRSSLDERKLYHTVELWLHKKGFLSYLQEGLTYIYNHFIETDHLFLELNKTALHHVLRYIEGLLAEITDCSISFFLNGLRQSSMLFHKDNPLTGLYIVEVSESYNLDFEHVFFLNMNEGHFPKVIYKDSFLPYDLCYSFGLVLVDQAAENKTAYGFYRLLQRAQNIYCSYTQKNHLDGSSEMSRLLIQLTFDSKLKIIPSYHSIHLLERPIAAITIQKDDKVMQLLDRFLGKEGVAVSSLTPAACISYLSCPLQFYFKYLLPLKEAVKDATEAVQLGTLFHDVMARLYRPFVGMQVDKSMVMEVKSKIKITIEKAMAASRTAFGSPILLHALLEKLLAAMLDVDGGDAPFTLLGIEVAIKQPMVLDAQRKVWLSGVIDRIDRHNHLIRIIDYKTGPSNCKISSIAGLFDPTKVKKNKAIFQLFFYAWLFQSLHGIDDPKPIMPYLIHIREIFLKDYIPGIFIQPPNSGKKYQRIEGIMAYAQPFEEGLKGLLEEIFNPAIPFSQTEDLEICSYCPYVRVCQRD